MVTHVESGFRFDYQDPSLADVQAINYVDTGFQARSTTNMVAVRPSTQVKADGNYYASGFLRGDHAVKFGYSYRTTPLEAINQVGGGATVRIRASGRNEADVHARSPHEHRTMGGVRVPHRLVQNRARDD